MAESTILRETKGMQKGFVKEDVMAYIDELNSRIVSLEDEIKKGAPASNVDQQEIIKYRNQVDNLQEKLNASNNALRAAKALFNNAPDLAGAIAKLIEENEHFKKEAEAVAKEKSAALKKSLADMSKDINGVNVVVINRPVNPAILKNACFMLQKEATNLAVIAAYEHESKPQLLLMYSNDLVEKGHNAVADIRDAAKLILGGGGGQPGLATAGGKDTANLQAAADRLVELATH